MATRKRSFEEVTAPGDDRDTWIPRRKTSSPPVDADLSSSSRNTTPQPTFSEVTHPSTTNTEITTSDDESSELSDSSEDPSSESEISDDDEDMTEGESEVDDEEVITVIPLDKRKRKPHMRLEQDERDTGLSLRQKLQTFLPQMKAANEELEQERLNGTLAERNIEGSGHSEDGQYIEMNLGLGVLEQKGEQGEDIPSESESSEGENDTLTGQRESDVLGKLMGRSKADASAIQEVEG